MTMTAADVFRWADLVEHLAYITDAVDPGWSPHRNGTPGTLTAARIAEVCGITQRSVQRHAAAGHLPPLTAEAIAERLGEHPALIWPDYPAAVRPDGRYRR